MMAVEEFSSPDSSAYQKLIRHTLTDRLFHWGTAASVLILLGTAFFPIMGWEFAWVDIHWISGIVLTLLVAFHTVRALFWQDIHSMWVSFKDLKSGIDLARWNLRLSEKPHMAAGKYSLAQKLIHHLFTLVVGVTIVTGCLMLVKIDTPWWERDPYWLQEGTWGIIYVLHDFGALLLITMLMAHVYFALRPEKLHFTRSMIFGWITRTEYEKHHDPGRWRVDAD
jgi:cytochrome b subunit of formate dehydrogenase